MCFLSHYPIKTPKHTCTVYSGYWFHVQVFESDPELNSVFTLPGLIYKNLEKMMKKQEVCNL
jgi:hypothetical protein